MKVKSRKKLGPSTTFFTGHDGKIKAPIETRRISKHAKAKQPQKGKKP